MTDAGTGVSLGPALIWCLFPDHASATTACSDLLDDGLIACANILPGIVSLFAWEGERREATEIGALLKTDAALLDKAIARLGELHPYEEPAVVGWKCDAALPATSVWLGALVR